MAELKLVAFDVFGTIADGNSHPGPYARISQELGVDGRQLSTMAQTRDVEVGPLIDLLAPSEPDELRRATELRVLTDLKEDLDHIYLFPETILVFSALQARGLKTALVSNLASAYAPRITSLLQEHQVLPEICIWSFEVGMKKPEAGIYSRLFEKANCSPEEVLFVGDRADRDLWPPRALGCISRLIARPGGRMYERSIEGIPPTDRIENLCDIFSVLKLSPELEHDSQNLELSRGLDRASDINKQVVRPIVP